MSEPDVVSQFYESLDKTSPNYPPFRMFMSKQLKERQIEIVKALMHYGLSTSDPEWIIFAFVVNAAHDLRDAKAEIATTLSEEGRLIVEQLAAYPTATKRLSNDVSKLLTATTQVESAYQGVADNLTLAARDLKVRHTWDVVTPILAFVFIALAIGFGYRLGDRDEKQAVLSAKQAVLSEILQRAQEQHNGPAGKFIEKFLHEEFARTNR